MSLPMAMAKVSGSEVVLTGFDFEVSLPVFFLFTVVFLAQCLYCYLSLVFLFLDLVFLA
jgi:hypothetical protein